MTASSLTECVAVYQLFSISVHGMVINNCKPLATPLFIMKHKLEDSLKSTSKLATYMVTFWCISETVSDYIRSYVHMNIYFIYCQIDLIHRK